MAIREYASGVSTTILFAIGAADGTASLADTTGWGTGAGGDFFATLDGGTDNEERVLCSALTGAVLTFITRGADGTTAKSHGAGASVWPSGSATDLREANAHGNAVAAIHGVAGTIVGTTDLQTLTNKTLTSPTITGGTITGAAVDATSLTQGGAALVDVSSTQTLTNKTLTSPIVNTPTVTGGTVNPTTLQQGGVAVVTTTGTQTLTNKTLTSPAITGALSGLTSVDATTLTENAIAVTTAAKTQTFTNKTIAGGTNTITGLAESSVTNLVSDLAAINAAIVAVTARLPFKMQAGYTTHAFAGGLGPVATAVTLTGFTQTPIVTLSNAGGPGGDILARVYVSGNSSSGFTVNVLAATGFTATITVYWMAYQATSGSASG